MSAIFRVPKSLCAGGFFLAFSLGLFGQNSVTNQGGEFSILGGLKGDQVLPSISLSPSGGCVIWQDNMIDKYGAGLGASLLDASFAAGAPFRANRTAVGNQIRPQVQLLADNKMIFVWQCSVAGIPHIYARFARNSDREALSYGTNLYTADIRVNTYLKDQQIDPVVTALPDGSAVVAWSSYGEDGSMFGIYARRLGATGKVVAGPKGVGAQQFLVNQFTSYNQRDPAIATLANGNYVIAWVSEQERSVHSVDVYARIFSADGVPVTDEIPINSGTNYCATPALAPLNDGGFTVVWAQKDLIAPTNGWDVWGRAFSAAGSPEVSDFRVNTYLYGDQYRPKIAAGPAGSLVVWTSLEQDGSGEGVYGRFLPGGTQVVSDEFRVNTTTFSKQIHPVVAWNGADRFLVVWSSFVGSTGFDLYGQAYVVNTAP